MHRLPVDAAIYTFALCLVLAHLGCDDAGTPAADAQVASDGTGTDAAPQDLGVADATPEAGEPPSDAAPVDAALDTGADAGRDVGPVDSTIDAMVDSRPDVALDAEPDAAPDAEPDAAPDAEPDAAPDAEPDAAPDALADAAPDAPPDALVDAAPDVLAEAVPDAEPDAAPDAEPPEPDAAHDATPEPDAAHDATPDPDAAPDARPDAEPDAAEPRCDDGAHNGDETDTDCGGRCAPCEAEAICAAPADCLSGVCAELRCAEPSCEDRVQNGGEVDVDCAGPCGPCDGGAQCGQHEDCWSLICEGAECAGGRCGDGVIQPDEACDDGDELTNECPANEGPCEVCTAACQMGAGVQVPAPRRWDGEAGDGRWESAANWDPDGVPTAQEWAVVGPGAEVTAEVARCHGLVIELGALVRQDARPLECDLYIAGTFEPAANGLIPNAHLVHLAGALGARTPWIDALGTPFEFVDGAQALNEDLVLRLREGVSLGFALSEAGFTPLRLGTAREPATWEEVAFRVDLSRYEGAIGERFTLLDFQQHDGTYGGSRELEVTLDGDRQDIEARLFWEAAESQLQLLIGSQVPPGEISVDLTPLEPTVLDTLRAEADSEHPTARFRYAWFVDDAPVAEGPALVVGEHAIAGQTIRLEVYAFTTSAESGPFAASVEVRDSPPVLRDLRILPPAPRADDVLSVEATVEDPDEGAAGELAGCQWQSWSEGSGWLDLVGEDAPTLAACSARPACEAGDRIRVLCVAIEGGEPLPSPAVEIHPAGCLEGDPVCHPSAFGGPPTVSGLDYSYWYWPRNHRPVGGPAYLRVMHVLTGHYGLSFDEETGALLTLGWLPDEQTVATARHRPNADIEGMPGAEIAFEAGPAEAPVRATSFLPSEGSFDDRARMRDGGRFMNFIELRNAAYADAPDLVGEVSIAAMPRHVVFNHRVEDPVARVRLGGDFLADLEAEWLAPERALRLSDAGGQGWLFVVYGDTTLAWTDEGVVAEHHGEGAHRVSLLVAPLSALNPVELDLYVEPATVAVDYTLLDLEGTPVGATSPLPWDPELGAFRATLGALATAGLRGSRSYDQRPELHNWYGRHRLRVDTHGRGSVALPLAFFGDGGSSLSITGGAVSLRDARGEPLGVPVQISKNWHDRSLGAWYHLYTQPRFAGLEPQTLELTIASSRWGREAYAASHAQLSLIGWNNAGGHWQQSAMGAFGESITYDPDLSLGRAMVDDVRPFLVQAANRWSWTGNVGGADFLRYRHADQPNALRRLGRLRSTYHAPGPNLTDVEYSGLSSDGRIQANIRVQMGRTDDVVRTWYHLEYTALEELRYDRLAFFQMAADRYGDNAYARAAWGDRAGVVEDRAIPDHGATGYADPADRGIPLNGEAPWVMLYDNQRADGDLPELYADLAYVVRHFEATLGGEVLRTPHLNVHRTNNRGSQFGLELGLPYDALNPVVPAGSTLRATVEYLVLPADKSVYYGASDYLLAEPAEDWRSPAMALRQAGEGQLSVQTSIGALRRTQPVEIDAATGPVAAEFSLEGGLGYVPITVHGLPRHDGWRLQRAEGGLWAEVDQSVHGNDYWQSTYDAEAGAYSLTYTVANRGAQDYRLIWAR